MANVFALTVQHYRFFNDDGSETTMTVAANEDTALTLNINQATPRTILRMVLSETGAGSISGATTDDYQLQYSYDGGAYTNVTTTSSVVKGFNSTNLTDAGTTTNNPNLTDGGGTFVAGEISESGLVTDRQITANNWTELVYTLEVVHANVANAKNIDFRVLLNGATTNMTYSVTPRITVQDTKRYALTGTWTWDATTTTNWGWYSNSAGGASVPGSAMQVFFDANSGAGTITFNPASNQTISSLDFTGFTGTFASGGSSALLIGTGDVTLASGMTYSFGNSLLFTGTSGTQNLTTNGKTLAHSFGIGSSAASTLKFLDTVSLTGNNFAGQSSGAATIDFNNLSHTLEGIDASSGTATFLLGTGTCTINASANFATTVTITPSTSLIKLTSNGSPSFTGGGKTYYNFEITQAFSFTMVGSNTFNTFTIDTAASTVKFTDGTTTTVSSFVADSVALTGTGTAGWTLSDASGTNSVTNCTIDHSTATGGATWNAYTTNGNTDGGSNVGWIFTAPSLLMPGGGFWHLSEGWGDPGVAVVPQTLHTINQGIAT